MARKKSRHAKGAATVVYDSDDERAYSKEPVPDKSQDDFFHDEIDEFHVERDKVLVNQGMRQLQPAAFSSDEEVLAVGGDSDSADDEIEEYTERLRQLKRHGATTCTKDSDDSEDEEAGLPSEKAWGTKRSTYYNADVDVSDDLEGSDEEAAREEEKEALAIQARMAAQLEDTDFDMDIFGDLDKEAKFEPTIDNAVERDFTVLNKREKLALLQRQSPELVEMVSEFRIKMKELLDILLPIHCIISDGTVPESDGLEYVKMKIRLNLDYCLNICYYLSLKANLTPVQNHNVIERLLQYRRIAQQLKCFDKAMAPKLETILEKSASGEGFYKIVRTQAGDSEKSKMKFLPKIKTAGIQKRKLSEMLDDEPDREVDPAQGGKSWGRKSVKGGKSGDNLKSEIEDTEPDGTDMEPLDEVADNAKRGITYEMQKNKGLMPHRKKELRNPRVKHRMKFRKALIRRKGQHREVRTETERYAGEHSGIRAGIKRGIKLK